VNHFGLAARSHWSSLTAMALRVLAWIDCYNRDAFNLEANQGSGADRTASGYGEDGYDIFCEPASSRL